MELPRSSALLRRVALRIRLRSLMTRFFVAFLALCGLFAAGILVGWWQRSEIKELLPLSLLVIPSAAMLLALLFHRRPEILDVARVIDQQSETKDLFLTV